MAAERHKPGDDGGLAKTDVAHDRHPPAGAAAGPVQMGVDLLEKPLAAREDRVHGDAGHLEQQRLEGDVLGPIGCKTYWWVRRRERDQKGDRENRSEVLQTPATVTCVSDPPASVTRLTHGGAAHERTATAPGEPSQCSLPWHYKTRNGIIDFRIC